MGDSDIDPTPANGNANVQNSGGQQDRQEWIRANFTQIFGTSAEDLQAQGINPRQYAREHRDKIRQFAQRQRSRASLFPVVAPPAAVDRATADPMPRDLPTGDMGMAGVDASA